MSAIGSIGSSAAAFVSRVNRSQGGRSPGGPDPIQQKLTQLLESQGVGSQEQSQIKDELETALETAFYSDSSPPTLSSLKETFDAVLEKHGIDGDQIAAALRPPVRGGEGGGPPPGGPEGLGGPGGPPPPAGGNGSVEEEDETESLLEILEKAAERARKQAAQNDEASVATRAQFSSSQFRSNQYNSAATSLLTASSTLAVEA